MNVYNRTISRADFALLHPGMVRLARKWNWTVVDVPDPEDPTLITLEDLAIEREVEPIADDVDPIVEPSP